MANIIKNIATSGELMMNSRVSEREAVAIVLFLLFITSIDDLLGISLQPELRIILALFALTVGIFILIYTYFRKM